MPVNSFENYPMSWKPKLEQSDTPIYINLAKQLKDDIMNGKLTPGTKLPPQRELADFLDINLSTITRAFKLCEKRGLICSAIGRGTYVSSDAACQNVLLSTTPQKDIIEMGSILPNPDINELASDYLRSMTKEPDFYKLLQYGQIEYDELQIKAASRYLSYSHIESDPSHILFSNGSQNAIFAVLASLFKEGEKIATMPVIYPGLKIAAKTLGIQLVPIPLHEGCLTKESLEYVYKNHNISGFYFIPDYNNPTAERMDMETRKIVAAFCNLNHLPVIEDAIYTLFDPEPLLPIAVYTPDYGIFISSVSKIMSPGLRLAVVHTAGQYKDKIRETLYGMQITSPAIMMQLFTRLVLSNTFDRIRELRIKEIKERNILFDQMCPKLKTTGSLYSPIRWLRLPATINADEFEKKAYKKNLQVFSASRFVVGSTRIPDAIRLSLISVHSIDRYKLALEILNDLLD